jgi:hypothetical protein
MFIRVHPDSSGMSTVSRSFRPDMAAASVSTSCYDGGLSVAICDTALHSGPPRTTPKSGFCGQCGGWSARHPRKGWTRGRGRGISGMNHLPPPRFLHLGCWIGSWRSDWPCERPGFIKLRFCRGRCGLAYCVTKSYMSIQGLPALFMSSSGFIDAFHTTMLGS